MEQCTQISLPFTYISVVLKSALFILLTVLQTGLQVTKPHFSTQMSSNKEEFINIVLLVIFTEG